MEVIKGDFGKTNETEPKKLLDFGKTNETEPKKLLDLLHEALASAGVDENTVGKFILIAEVEGDKDDFKVITAYDTMETNYIMDIGKLTFLGY